MARRTKEAAQETRNRILDTAEQVFHEKGVSHTTLADIAQLAGVTRGAIYWHFKNKADLFQAMMDRVLLPMEQASAKGIAEHADPLARVRHCALTVLHHLTTDAQSQRVFEIMCHKVEYVDDMMPLRARHIECRADFLTQLEHGFKDAAKHGLLKSDVTPRHAAVGLHALIDGLIMNWVLDPKYFPLRKSAEGMIDLYLDGLRGVEKTGPTRSRATKPAGRSSPKPARKA